MEEKIYKFIQVIQKLSRSDEDQLYFDDPYSSLYNVLKKKKLNHPITRDQQENHQCENEKKQYILTTSSPAEAIQIDSQPGTPEFSLTPSVYHQSPLARINKQFSDMTKSNVEYFDSPLHYKSLQHSQVSNASQYNKQIFNLQQMQALQDQNKKNNANLCVLQEDDKLFAQSECDASEILNQNTNVFQQDELVFYKKQQGISSSINQKKDRLGSFDCTDKVGKTSIIQRFVHDDFKQKTQQTTGVHYDQKTIQLDNDQKVDFKVWDTAGQERFRSINALYYKDAAVALLVYDITSKSSFETLKYWADELLKYGKEDVLIVIVGNKQDLIEQEQVYFDQATTYARSIGAASVKLTSCKENRGIEELFKDIGNQLIAGYKRQRKQNNQSIANNLNDDGNSFMTVGTSIIKNQNTVISNESHQISSKPPSKKQDKKDKCC